MTTLSKLEAKKTKSTSKDIFLVSLTRVRGEEDLKDIFSRTVNSGFILSPPAQ